MRNAVLAIATTFVLAVPTAAPAQDKHKDWIELQSYSHQNTQPATSSQGKVEFNYTLQNRDGPKTLNAVGGSTGPTKPPLPTTVPTTGVRHQ